MTDRTLLEAAFDAGFASGRDDKSTRRIAAPRLTFPQQAMAIIGALIGGFMMITGMGGLYEDRLLGIILFVGGIVVLGAVAGTMIINSRRKLSQVNALMDLRRQEDRQAFVQDALNDENDIEVAGEPVDEVVVGERKPREPQVNERIPLATT